MSCAPVDLRCEYLCDPVGVDVVAPRFSWRLSESCATGGQQAYELQVADAASSLDADGPLRWETGRVASRASVHVVYAGPPLASGRRYYWRVRVWDDDGRCSAWSQVATWVTGVFESDEWSQAQWIGLPVEPEATTDLCGLIGGVDWIAPPAEVEVKVGQTTDVAFRRIAEMPQVEIERAVLVAASSSNLVFELNRRPVIICQGYRPAVAVDVTWLLRAGANVLTATVVHEGRPEVPIAIRGVLFVRWRDGHEHVCATDAEWRCASNPANGWKELTYDDEHWSGVVRACEETEGLGPVEDVADEHRAVPAVYLRREWAMPEEARDVVLHVVGLGYHEVHVNGTRVGDHVLDPALTDYQKRVLSVTHDIGDLVQPGANAIGVVLGNGRFFAPRRRVPIPAVHFGDPRLRLMLEWTEADGRRNRLVSDEAWAATTEGPIRANNDYDGETYDARAEFAGWSRPGFDAGAWQPVRVYEPLSAKVAGQIAEPIRVTERIAARRISTVSRGRHICDFGQNVVGWVQLRVQGARGSRVAIRHAERVGADGLLAHEGLRSSQATDVYTLRGGGVETYAPRFTYHGFRYVEVCGPEQAPRPEDVEACVVHSDVERVGAFRCSDETINRVFDSFVWGAKGNLRSVPTDCPQRDERQGWLGDIANVSKGENYVFRTINFYRKWLADIQDAQLDDGNLPDVAPAYWQLYSGNVTWPAAYVVIAGWLYEQFGDVDLLRQHYPNMCRWLAHLRGQYKNGVLEYDTYGDWCVPPESPELIHSKDASRQTDGTLLAMATHVHVLRLVSRMARVLGAEDDARDLSDEAGRLARSYHERFYDAGRNCYGNGTQTSFALSLASGLVPRGERAAVAGAFARRVLEQDGGHIATGLVGGQWLLRSLDDCGHAELALRIAQQRTYPSWGYMVEHGATTLWELWNGNTADPAMNSHNHLMLAGDLPIWLFERLAGIQAQWDTPGYSRFVLAPRFVRALDDVAARHDCIRGRICSEWRRPEKGGIEYCCVVPPNTGAVLRLDGTGRRVVYVGIDGRALWDDGEIGGGDIDVAPGEAGPRITLLPGEYQFEIRCDVDE